MKFSKLFLVCALTATSLSALAQQETKTFIYGGDIYSADPKNPHPQAVAIQGRKIIAVGSYQDVLQQAGPDAARLDLSGTHR